MIKNDFFSVKPDNKSFILEQILNQTLKKKNYFCYSSKVKLKKKKNIKATKGFAR